MRMRIGLLLALLVVGLTLKGYCRDDKASEQITLGKPKIIYQSPGKIGAIAVQPGSGQKYFLLQEWKSEGKEEMQGRNYLVRLDASSGKSGKIAALAPNIAGPMSIAYAHNGRIAIREERYQPGGYQYRISVREPGGTWRPVSQWSNELQTPVAWSPDSTSLLCHRSSGNPAGFDYSFSVATAASPKQQFVQTEIAKNTASDMLWETNGRRLYAVNRGHAKVFSVDWPSRKETALFSAVGLQDLSIAEATGEVVALSEFSAGKAAVWKLSPGAGAKATGAVLSPWPVKAAISPDGRQIAGTQYKTGGLIVYDLNSGKSQRVSALAGKNVMRIQWALGGRALIFIIAPKGVHDWDNKAMGSQVWLVPVEKRNARNR
jgi:hypothetical protein